MGVLRDLVGVCKSALGQEFAVQSPQEILKLKLMVICTAFELLTGQGELSRDNPFRRFFVVLSSLPPCHTFSLLSPSPTPLFFDPVLWRNKA
jgi:hypothetical protein